MKRERVSIIPYVTEGGLDSNVFLHMNRGDRERLKLLQRHFGRSFQPEASLRSVEMQKSKSGEISSININRQIYGSKIRVLKNNNIYIL